MKIQNILVPVDFSENSINALKYASDFARVSGAAIYVLHVTDTDSIENDLKGNLAPDHLLDLITREDYMRGITVKGILEKGNVTRLILAESKANQIDLVIMGTQGAGNMTRNLIGTHTSAVIAKSECMVLAIPSQVTFSHIRKVVMAIDLENRADKLVMDSISLFQKMEAAVLLVYVGTDKNHKEEHDLEEMAEDLKRTTGYLRIDCTVIHSNNFKESIEKFAMDIDADVIATITHHRNVFESIFDPSQTKQMSYHLNTPLMSIPQKHKTTFFF
jgi:nucleotide-binding universal stress UspA family protein